MNPDNRSRGNAPPPIIPPQTSRARVEELLSQLLGTRVRDWEALEASHRALLAASPRDYKRLLAFLRDREPASPHLIVGLSLLSTGADMKARQFAGKLLRQLPLQTVAEVVDYIHGWYVDRTHTLLERQRFDDEMTEAYDAAAPVVQEALKREGVLSTDSQEFVGGEILITLGEYDKVQQVLDALGMTYRTLPCQVVHKLPLRADQVLIVNCPGRFAPPGIAAIRRFVVNGGTLITTDWALATTLQLAFPELCQWNQVATRDDVVKVSWVNSDSPYTRGVEVPNQTISWWLEGSSYPIKILDDRVQVLMGSREMQERYGESPIVVTFAYGEGMVFHLTSHYYLQRSQGDRNSQASEVVSSLGIDIQDSEGIENMSGSQFAAAYSSMRLLANILYDRRRAYGV